MRGGGDTGFLPEVERVMEVLDSDHAWFHWWRSVSKAPVLDLAIFLLRTPQSLASVEANIYAGCDERVVRGRRRHLVRMHVDSDELSALEPDERRLLALPTVLDGISRVTTHLKIVGVPPPVPPAAQPAPLPPGVLRRRRLKELLD
ncbi:hypothetical protein GCM10029976_056920 [Kribbella albertanoniae]